MTTATDGAEANTWPYSQVQVSFLHFLSVRGIQTPVSGDMLAKKGNIYVD